jgi:hypothetical protein
MLFWVLKTSVADDKVVECRKIHQTFPIIAPLSQREPANYVTCSFLLLTHTGIPISRYH